MIFLTSFINNSYIGNNTQHDEQSGKMFEFLINENDLDKEMKKYNLGEMDKKFIRTMILGLNPKTDAVSHFLY